MPPSQLCISVPFEGARLDRAKEAPESKVVRALTITHFLLLDQLSGFSGSPSSNWTRTILSFPKSAGLFDLAGPCAPFSFASPFSCVSSEPCRRHASQTCCECCCEVSSNPRQRHHRRRSAMIGGLMVGSMAASDQLCPRHPRPPPPGPARRVRATFAAWASSA